MGFLAPIFATTQGKIGIGWIGGHSLEFLGHPTSNHTLNPTPILPKKLLRLWALLTMFFCLADTFGGNSVFEQFGGNSYIPQKEGKDASRRGLMPLF